MGHYILHKDGAYNIYSTIVDAPLHDNAMTLDELTEEIGCEHGQSGVRQLPDRLDRAHRNGTSAMNYTNLADCVSLNRAGENESELTLDEFVARFLTLPKEEMAEQEAMKRGFIGLHCK